MSRARYVVMLVGLGVAASAAAHHSFAPHFDPESSVTITGKILEFEKRNPHAYIHIEAADDAGELQEYICESSGVTQLKRNGIDPALFEPGLTVTVSGQQHRRDPYRCFFRTIQLEGGPVLGIGNAGQPLAPPATPAVDPVSKSAQGIFGNWLLITRGPGAGNRESFVGMLEHMTAAGVRAEAAYDPYLDDPVYRCNPVGIRRVWFAPGTPLEIVREDDRVVIRHEWMDVERVVHLDVDEHPARGAETTFGHSIGRLVDGVLTIETANYPDGVIRQYAEGDDERPFRGLLHSEALTTTEILRFDEESQSLEVTMLFRDPQYYDRDFPPVTTRYERTDLQVRPFGCIPEN